MYSAVQCQCSTVQYSAIDEFNSVQCKLQVHYLSTVQHSASIQCFIQVQIEGGFLLDVADRAKSQVNMASYRTCILVFTEIQFTTVHHTAL